jgi:sodium-dependent dicarboxylate transporter 2/3/5
MTALEAVAQATTMKPKKYDFSLKGLIACILAIGLCLLFQFVVPVPTGLERPAISVVGLLLACVVLWVAEAVPFIVTVIFILVMLPVIGVTPITDVYKNFGVSTVFFCLVSFGLSAAITMTPVPKRVAYNIFKFSKTNPKKLVMSFAFCTTIISMFVSDLAACAVFASLAIAVLKANGDPKPGTSNLGKALLCAVAGGAAIGGIGTPIGNSLNILSISMVEQFMNVRVTFVAWCVMAIPIAISVTLFIGWWACKVFPPETVSQEAIDTVREEVAGAGKFSFHEWKLFVWFTVMLAFWIASTWIPQINMIVVGLIGICIAFIPGVNLLERKHYYSSIGWDVVFMIGGVSALATGLVGTGVAQWFVELVFSGATAWPMIIVLILIALIFVVLHILIPVGPPVVSIAMPVCTAIALLVGVSGAPIALIGGILGGVTMVIPVDAIMLISYEKGYYKMTEFMKFGIPSMIVLTALTVAVLPILAPLLGY